MSSITLRQLEYFCVLAETLSFRTAADQCAVSQPTLTSAIQVLEQQLGIALFERDRRSVLLTPEGRALLAQSKQIVQLSQDLATKAMSAAQVGRSQVVIGAIPTIAPFWVESVLAVSAQKFADLRIQFQELQTHQLIQALREGRVDIGLLALPADIEELAQRQLRADRLKLVVSRQSAMASSATAVSLSTLQANEMVWLEEGHCLRDHGIAACSLEGALPEALSVNSLLTMVRLVASGYGAALLPQLAIDAGLIDNLPITEVETREQPTRDLVAICRQTHPNKRFLLGEFADALAAL
ncbi:MAG: LysR family transcriptional regulator [Gammaproteobacteria bacterium]|nr:LysR family transcriptional regulator [Gammaproteobacteria bacterium]